MINEQALLPLRDSDTGEILRVLESHAEAIEAEIQARSHLEVDGLDQNQAIEGADDLEAVIEAYRQAALEDADDLGAVIEAYRQAALMAADDPEAGTPMR